MQPQLNNFRSLQCDHHRFRLPWHGHAQGDGYCSRWRLHGLGAQLSDIRHRDPFVDSSHTDECSELHWGGNFDLVRHSLRSDRHLPNNTVQSDRQRNYLDLVHVELNVAKHVHSGDYWDQWFVGSLCNCYCERGCY